MYGKDLIHNAIDVSPTVEKAQNDIHLIFGDIDQEEQGEKTYLIIIKNFQNKKTKTKHFFSLFKII
jgi:predicted deacetylase